MKYQSLTKLRYLEPKHGYHEFINPDGDVALQYTNIESYSVYIIHELSRVTEILPGTTWGLGFVSSKSVDLLYITSNVGDITYDDSGYPVYNPKGYGKKCECGAVKAGTPYHAFWCDLYVDPKYSGKPDKPKLDEEMY